MVCAFWGLLRRILFAGIVRCQMFGEQSALENLPSERLVLSLPFRHIFRF